MMDARVTRRVHADELLVARIEIVARRRRRGACLQGAGRADGGDGAAEALAAMALKPAGRH